MISTCGCALHALEVLLRHRLRVGIAKGGGVPFLVAHRVKAAPIMLGGLGHFAHGILAVHRVPLRVLK